MSKRDAVEVVKRSRKLVSDGRSSGDNAKLEAETLIAKSEALIATHVRSEAAKGLLKILPQGHGSGLDADMVDGLHAGQILAKARMYSGGSGSNGNATKIQDKGVDITSREDDTILVFKTAQDKYIHETKSAPSVHATTHENGGGDEISVAGLSGELADPQTPKAHNQALTTITGHNKAAHDALGIDAATLGGSTKNEVRDHDPKAHSHVEADITDLDHDAQKIKGKTVDDAAIGDGKFLKYQTSGDKVVYATVPGGGDMLKSTYDTDEDGVVDNSEKLEGSTKTEVQNHAPQSHGNEAHSSAFSVQGHTHVEANITDLDHDAQRIKSVEVDNTAIGEGKALVYRTASGKLGYEAFPSASYKLAPTFTIYKVGSTYYVMDADGNIYTSGLNASTVIQAAIDQAIADDKGGWIHVKKGIYDIPTALSLVGAGAPSLGADLDIHTLKITGEGRWATVFRKTGSAGNIFEFSNAISVRLEDCYLYQNSINGYPIRGLSTGASDRCMMRGGISNVEIHGVASGYYGIYLTNPYFINTFENIYIRAPNGIMLDCDATGYGNQHFENIFISLSSTNGKGIYLRRAGANLGENTFNRTHIDGNSYAAGNVAIQLYGSKYNHFTYVKLEHFAEACIRIESGADSFSNVFEGGYLLMNAGTFFDFNTTNSRANVAKNIHCSASGTPMLIEDACNSTLTPDIFEDVWTDYSGFPSPFVSRTGIDRCIFRGVIGQKKGNHRGTATMPSGSNPYVDVTHGLCLAPVTVKAIGNNADVKDLYITNIDETSFRINAVGSVASNRTIYWEAMT